MEAAKTNRGIEAVTRGIHEIMRSRRITRIQLVALLAVLAAAGCSGAATSSPTAATTPTIVPSNNAQPTPAGQPTAGVSFEQPWAVATLTDVTTGAQFRIADLAAEGKVVFIETMAIWCTNCRVQQEAATAAMAELDPSRVAWVALDVETSESADALARYRDQHGFPFRYAISDTNLSRALANEFGDVVLSPPSVNVIVLGTDGRVTHLVGHHSAADLVVIAGEHGA